MRFIARLLLGVCLAVAVAGCGNSDRHYFKEGVGANLYAESAIAISEDANTRTDLQRQYVDDICQQAGLLPGECGPGVTSPRVWSAFVQAGMNDIDQRCDAYLLWLDNVRRAQGPTLKQLADTQTATTIIMREAGIGVAPITIAAAAFGLAIDTFTNVTARLVLEVDRSTVQTLVLSRQRRYREDLFGSVSSRSAVSIDSRPAAIFALRSYLRLCMPMTIETEINTTIATFERGGADALARGTPMISAQTVSVAMQATDKVRDPGRRPAPADPEYAKFFVAYTPQKYPKPYVEGVFKALCVPIDGAAVPGPVIDGLVRISEQALRQTPDGQLDTSDTPKILMPNGPSVPCSESGAQNYFERTTYTDAEKLKTLMRRLDATVGGAPLPENATLKDARTKIKEARKKKTTASDLTLPDSLSGQMTRDLDMKLDFPK